MHINVSTNYFFGSAIFSQIIMIIICKRLTPQGLSVWTQIYSSLVIASCWSKTGICPDVWGLFGRIFGTKAWENRSYIGAKFYCNKKFGQEKFVKKLHHEGKKSNFTALLYAEVPNWWGRSACCYITGSQSLFVLSTMYTETIKPIQATQLSALMR